MGAHLVRGGEEVPSGVTVTEQSAGSFEEFVAIRGDALWRSAWLLAGDAQRAEDLVQTALGKCWSAWDRIAADGSFEAYVRRAMYTTYASWWRRTWKVEIPTASPPDAAAPAGQSELRADLMRALATLPTRQRATVVLRYFEDLSERETAAILGCSVGTVKSHSARALAALRASSILQSEED